jgi:hypothetical protein
MGSQSVFGEVYQGGSAEAERYVFEKLARDIMRMQVDNRGSSRVIQFPRKVLAGVANVKLRILDDIPDYFRIGYVKPRSEYEAIVRLSNANGASRADAKRDMRGQAACIKGSDHDLSAANFPGSHAGDARQFVAFARAMAGSKQLFLPRLCVAQKDAQSCTGELLEV